MEDKLCLKWNDFQENISTSFGRLRQDGNFSDVTLVCEDGEQIDSHKIILAAFSPFFEKLLERNDHPHPLIFMRGTKKDDLASVIDFLYCGEANILEKNLESFLAIAGDLKVKGLQREEKERAKQKEIQQDKKETEKQKEQEMGNLAKPNPKPPSKRKEKQINNSTSEIKCEPNAEDGATISLNDQLQMHRENVKSMLEKSENHISNESYNLLAYSCKVCGKEGVKTNMEKHIEVHHMENIALACLLCEKSFGLMTALVRHKKTSHIDVLIVKE